MYRHTLLLCNCKGPSTAALEELQQKSITKMQGVVRMHLAHSKLQEMLQLRFKKYFDPQMGAYYYYDNVGCLTQF